MDELTKPTFADDSTQEIKLDHSTDLLNKLNLISIEDFFKVELKVGEILNAEAVPKSKKLLKLNVSLGEFGEKQILSGISESYLPEDLIGKKVVIVYNLNPVKMMGLTSEGMLLAGMDEDTKRIYIVEPNAELKPGNSLK